MLFRSTLDEAGVLAKFGVRPDQIVDYLSLTGDAVDNVPGVEKVGPKTAVKWISQYGSLDGVVAHAGEIGGVVGANLRKALDWLPQGRRLVTVVTDCDLAGHVPGWPAIESLALAPVDKPAMLDFLQRYGFGRLKNELAGELGVEAPATARAAAPVAAGSEAASVVPPGDAGLARHYETVLTQIGRAHV